MEISSASLHAASSMPPSARRLRPCGLPRLSVSRRSAGRRSQKSTPRPGLHPNVLHKNTDVFHRIHRFARVFPWNTRIHSKISRIHTLGLVVRRLLTSEIGPGRHRSICCVPGVRGVDRRSPPVDLPDFHSFAWGLSGYRRNSKGRRGRRPPHSLVNSPGVG